MLGPLTNKAPQDRTYDVLWGGLFVFGTHIPCMRGLEREGPGTHA